MTISFMLLNSHPTELAFILLALLGLPFTSSKHEQIIIFLLNKFDRTDDVCRLNAEEY